MNDGVCTEGLGFEVAEGWGIGDSMAQLAEVSPPMDCRSQTTR